MKKEQRLYELEQVRKNRVAFLRKSPEYLRAYKQFLELEKRIKHNKALEVFDLFRDSQGGAIYSKKKSKGLGASWSSLAPFKKLKALSFVERDLLLRKQNKLRLEISLKYNLIHPVNPNTPDLGEYLYFPELEFYKELKLKEKKTLKKTVKLRYGEKRFHLSRSLVGNKPFNRMPINKRAAWVLFLFKFTHREIATNLQKSLGSISKYIEEGMKEYVYPPKNEGVIKRKENLGMSKEFCKSCEKRKKCKVICEELQKELLSVTYYGGNLRFGNLERVGAPEEQEKPEK